MKRDIILAGVGGQGILSIATVLGEAAIEMGLHIKQAEVHGMSQRGGDVQSHLRISDSRIDADIIPSGKADLIVSLEPMEALRYLSFLADSGTVVANTVPVCNIQYYPEKEVMHELLSLKNKEVYDMEEVAKEVAVQRCSNMVLLGTAAKYIDMPKEVIITSIRKIFESKGEKMQAMNVSAFNAGYNHK